jgi:GTPase SAR1 family protein
MLIGNKCDMNDKRQVSKERGEKLAIEYGMKCLETSAKLNENIENAFFTLAKDIKAKTEKRLVKIFVMKTLTRNILYKIFFFYLRTKIDRRLVQTTLVLIK